MTTDTHAKEVAVAVSTTATALYTVGGCGKGSGMIHPNMATMLCFVTTDADVEHEFLRIAAAKWPTRRSTWSRSTATRLAPTRFSCSPTAPPDCGASKRGRRRRRSSSRPCSPSAPSSPAKLARDGEGARHLINRRDAAPPRWQDARPSRTRWHSRRWSRRRWPATTRTGVASSSRRGARRAALEDARHMAARRS